MDKPVPHLRLVLPDDPPPPPAGKPRALPLGEKLGPMIDRLRAVVAEAGDHALLGDGPVQPDAKLLEMCAEALHYAKVSAGAMQARRDSQVKHYRGEATIADLSREKALYQQSQEADRAMKNSLYWISKERATTPAAIYAKALVVRASKTGAATLAMTLADELIACPGLRASLWPAETGAAS